MNVLQKFCHVNYIKLAIVGLLILQIFQCVDSASHSRISGSSEIPIEAASFQASIRLKSLEKQLGYGEGHICSGAVVSQRLIVSSAQCFLNSTTDPSAMLTAGNYSVVLGSADRYKSDNNTLTFDVMEISIHESFNASSLENDIAVLFIDGYIAWDWPTVSAVALKDGPATTDQMCLVTGWGRTEAGENPRVLRRGIVPINADATCKSSYEGFLPASELCAGYEDGNVNFCADDIGNPLQCSNQLAGIASYNKGCVSLHPGVYSNVTYFKDWIINRNASFDYNSYGGSADSILSQSKLFIIVPTIFGFLISFLLQV